MVAQKLAALAILEKLSEENNRPKGENSPNLVALMLV
jgi:hypothetical protein